MDDLLNKNVLRKMQKQHYRRERERRSKFVIVDALRQMQRSLINRVEVENAHVICYVILHNVKLTRKRL